MLQKVRVLLLVGITAVLAACGGGDGGGDATPNFAGTYQMSTLNLTSNTCGGSPDASIAGGFDTVVQNGRNVSASGGTVTGTVDGDNGGFTITKTDVINGVSVVTSLKFRVTATGASTFSVQLSATGSAGSASCAITYTGTAVKG
jgi:hypothetical protein